MNSMPVCDDYKAILYLLNLQLDFRNNETIKYSQ